ncbi:MAG: J domain-containing protein [Sphaerobacteraceae bacterium]|nr:MAG: J domain-containing protein [Sphaerobacteraceae bacterium]
MTAHRRKFDPNVNYYEILDVPYSANRTEITRAYRHLMRYAHPDNHAGEQDRRKAEERAKMLNAAYAVLGKPDVRREYDQVFKRQAVSDAIFQRYTGNTPGQNAGQRPERPPLDPELRRQQNRANRSAFFQIMLFAAICAGGVIVLIVVLSLAGQFAGFLFS